MTQLMRQAKWEDEMDRIVETLIAHPERAPELKALLRARFENPSVVRISPVRVVPVPQPDEADDMWDNVPV
ncbi:hypothetical protein [Silicimonas sp. MF1-12-2]|uniref:hypothetical protein n=1 Tax=Silicimonas sp. MF1-12-2 TaxID=3384793 RepID=UPI0039B4A3FD